MKSFNECILDEEIEQARKESKRNRNKAKQHVKFNVDMRLDIFMLFVVIPVLLILVLISYVTLLTKDYNVDNTEEVVQDYTEGSIEGDDVPASGYASLEALEAAEGIKVEMLSAEDAVEDVEVIPTSHGSFTVTHYCGCSKCCGKYSSGSEADAWGCRGDKLTSYYSIAADPKVIPYGTEVHDANGNKYIVQDVGGGVKGNHIDMFVGSHQEALNAGVYEVELFW